MSIFCFTYIFIIFISYFTLQVLSGILVSGNRVILLFCFFFLSVFLREVMCKFIFIYIYIYINCLDCLERALFISFLPLNSHRRCKKSLQKEKLQPRELNVCAWQTSFSAIFLLNKIIEPKFINNPHLKEDPWLLCRQRSWTKAEV